MIRDPRHIPMGVDDGIHKCKSETVTGRMFSFYEALENSVADIGCESRAIVFDDEFCRPLMRL